MEVELNKSSFSKCYDNKDFYHWITISVNEVIFCKEKGKTGNRFFATPFIYAPKSHHAAALSPRGKLCVV